MRTRTQSLPLYLGTLALAGLVGFFGCYLYVRSQYLKVHPPVHFHANFAIYINGQKTDLSAPKYMEDIGSCTAGSDAAPRERTHLHSGVGDVVHVHDEHVTWADFLKNIGFYVDRTHLLTDTGTVYTNGNGQILHFILNGKAVDDPSNSYIGDEDRLLISFGNEKESDLITGQYTQVANTAGEYDHNNDPATCKGTTTPGFRFWL